MEETRSGMELLQRAMLGRRYVKSNVLFPARMLYFRRRCTLKCPKLCTAVAIFWILHVFSPPLYNKMPETLYGGGCFVIGQQHFGCRRTLK